MSNTRNNRVGTDERKARGKRAEDIAAQNLQNQGYIILARNWRCRSGELDLIVTRDDLIVIVEVRSRSSYALSYGSASESITPRKIKKVRDTAAVYLQQTGKLQSSIRFDVITVLFLAEGELTLEHIEAAF
jgi:putative endonuclease